MSMTMQDCLACRTAGPPTLGVAEVADLSNVQVRGVHAQHGCRLVQEPVHAGQLVF